MVTENFGSQLHLILPTIVGAIIGLLEVWFVMKDESNSLAEHLLKDGWHGFTFSILGTIIAANVPYFVNLFTLSPNITSLLLIDSEGRSVVISALITLFLLIKMVVAKSIKGNLPGVKEKFLHKLIIASLAGFSPYYIFLLYPLAQEYLGDIPYI